MIIMHAASASLLLGFFSVFFPPLEIYVETLVSYGEEPELEHHLPSPLGFLFSIEFPFICTEHFQSQLQI